MPNPNLTPKEQEIFELLKKGLANKEIGYQASCSEGTVKVYASRIYKKLGIHGKTELVVKFLSGELLPNNPAEELTLP